MVPPLPSTPLWNYLLGGHQVICGNFTSWNFLLGASFIPQFAGSFIFLRTSFLLYSLVAPLLLLHKDVLFSIFFALGNYLLIHSYCFDMNFLNLFAFHFKISFLMIPKLSNFQLLLGFSYLISQNFKLSRFKTRLINLHLTKLQALWLSLFCFY